MARKKPTTKRAKAQPSKPTKALEAKGGGGADERKAVADEMDSSEEKNSALPPRASLTSRISSRESRQLIRHLMEAMRLEDQRPQRRLETERERTGQMVRLEAEVTEQYEMIARLRHDLFRALNFPTLPDGRGGIYDMLRRAPTAWHIRTVVEVAVDVLISHSRRDERESEAMRCLGEIARLFRSGLKLQAKRSRRIRDVLEHTAYLEALNRPPPKCTRGGTGGNDSKQVVFTWTEMIIIQFDKRFNPDYDPLIYCDTESYIRKFMAYAKEWFEEEGLGWAEALVGMKARTNNSKVGGKPKQSFSLFKREIERNARNFLEGWQKQYAPVWVFTDKPPNPAP